MGSIQWRPEVNALTTPQSYWIRFVPRYTAGSADMAERLAKELPNYSVEEFRTFLATRNEILRKSLLNGEMLTEENAFTYYLSFTGRLNDPDEPLPSLNECLNVRVRVSAPFIESLRQAAHTERLPMEKKVPVISMVEDTLLKLNDVLLPEGVLQLTGADLLFQPESGRGECVIEGTQSGQAVQHRFPMISNTTIMLMPDVPTQAHLWNNEYTISLSTHYSEHGTLRTGIYGRLLRTPLHVIMPSDGSPTDIGILTGGSPADPYVTITGGTATDDEMLRIQAVLDMRHDSLLFSLLDMKEGGAAGPAATITDNGDLTLSGFTNSAVSSLRIRVNNYAALKELIRNDYSGRLVDLLQLELI